MGQDTDRNALDVSEALPAEVLALRSRLEEQWRIMLERVQAAALVIDFIRSGPPGRGMARMVDVLFTLSTLPRDVFLKELEESPDAVLDLLQGLLGLAVGELGYRVSLDKVLDGNDADQVGGESGRDAG